MRRVLKRGPDGIYRPVGESTEADPPQKKGLTILGYLATVAAIAEAVLHVVGDEAPESQSEGGRRPPRAQAKRRRREG